jgi:hypothetical protein
MEWRLWPEAEGDVLGRLGIKELGEEVAWTAASMEAIPGGAENSGWLD